MLRKLHSRHHNSDLSLSIRSAPFVKLLSSMHLTTRKSQGMNKLNCASGKQMKIPIPLLSGSRRIEAWMPLSCSDPTYFFRSSHCGCCHAIGWSI